MPIHIGQLISSVTVSSPTAAGGRPTAPMPPLDLVLRQSSQQSAPAVPSPTAVADSTSNPAPAPSVDPKDLADRVYRLMIDEAVIARERA
jgi:hypothetical protein